MWMWSLEGGELDDSGARERDAIAMRCDAIFRVPAGGRDGVGKHKTRLRICPLLSADEPWCQK